MLDEYHYILVILYKAQPREEFGHDLLMKVVHDAELLEVSCLLDHLLLDLLHFIVVTVVNLDRHLVSIVVQVDKTIVEEEATVALLAIAIIDLLPSLNVIQCFNNEAATVIGVVPGGLPGTSMV